MIIVSSLSLRVNQAVTVKWFSELFAFHTQKDFDRLEHYCMALFLPYLNIIFTYFVVIFNIYPELTTVN